MGLLLRQADGVKRVLMVGAHPDDEDTSLLAALSRTRGVRTVYLSLTRGEGGQNRIGDEMGEELGILRSAELLAARRLDGADQRFSRAYDFGYSRTAGETFDHWRREDVLADLVWAIRSFRPHVVVSIFSGTDRDGHGHHQAAGRLATAAYEAAADSNRFPEHLRRGREPWEAAKLYVHSRRDAQDATVAVATGFIDPLLGRSPHQAAMESRSQHRSQSFGTVEPPGAHASWLRLESTRTRAPPDAPLFTGIDTTLAGLARRLHGGPDRRSLVREIERYRDHLHAARRELDAEAPERIVPPLLRAARALGRARERLEQLPSGESSALGRELVRREELIGQAASTAAGVRMTARAADHELVPGQRVRVRAQLWNGGESTVVARRVELVAPPSWEVSDFEGDEPFPERRGPFGGTRSLPVPVEADTTADGAVRIGPGAIHGRDLELRVPRRRAPSVPYYLRRPRRAAAYDWPDDPEAWTLPFAPLGLEARAVVELRPDGEASGPGQDAAVTLRAPLRFRGLDRTSGEFWRDVRVVPTLSIAVRPALLVLPFDRERRDTVAVTVRNLAPDPRAGVVALQAPAKWSVDPDRHAFSLEGETRDTTVRFRVRPPAEGSRRERVRIDAVATLESGERLGREVRRIRHPHIEPRLRTAPAGLTVLRLPISVADRRVGFVSGPSETTADAIRRLGLEVERLEEDDWTPDRLADFDVIVVGTRAYETRSDLRSANPLLLEWARRGGVLLVQYNRYDLVGRTFSPFPLVVDRPPVRVTEEDAEVRFLDPDAPVFTSPNRIDERDFEGWVQERATFMPRSWDDRYRALLAMSDTGRPEARGSLLVAPLGEGVYVHVTLSLFRQFEAAVPGAYRLLANLLSLDPDAWSEARPDG